MLNSGQEKIWDMYKTIWLLRKNRWMMKDTEFRCNDDTFQMRPTHTVSGKRSRDRNLIWRVGRRGASPMSTKTSGKTWNSMSGMLNELSSLTIMSDTTINYNLVIVFSSYLWKLDSILGCFFFVLTHFLKALMITL